MPKFKIYFFITLSMIFWSFSFIWTGVALDSFLPMTLITLRLVFASLLLFLFNKIIGKFQVVRRDDVKWFLLLAFFEPFLYYVGETYGLTLVTPTLASVIIATIPLFAPLAGLLFLKERISLNNIIGIAISLIGVFMVVYEVDSTVKADFGGILLLFLAVFGAVCYATTLRKIPAYYSPSNIIFYQSLFGLIFFIPTFVIVDSSSLGEMQITSKSVGALFMLVVFASVLAFVLFARTVRKIGVTKSNVFVNLIPVFTAIFSWLILDERLIFIKWLGIGIVVLGLFVSQWVSGNNTEKSLIS